MKKNKNILAPLFAFCILALLVAVMLLTYFHFSPKAIEGAKEIKVDVVIPDEKTREFTLSTDAQYLSQALEEDNLIKGDNKDYGLFITEVNGRTINSNKQEWWCITKSGEVVNTGADLTPIADGDHYEITLKVGY